MAACIETCSACYDICQRMIYDHCPKLGGAHVEPRHLKLMADCADLCRIAADFMLRGSPRHKLTCNLCAEICHVCADDCERIGQMAECVKVCRQCAESCREMAGEGT